MIKRNSLLYILLSVCLLLCSCGKEVDALGTVLQSETVATEGNAYENGISDSAETSIDTSAEASIERLTEEPTEVYTEEPTEEPTEVYTEEPTEEPDALEPSDTLGIDPSDWNMILVNPWNKMPEGYTVELADIGYGHYIDVRAYDDLQEMLAAAYAAGVDPAVCSSYRTHEKQTSLYWNKVAEYRGYGYEESEAQRLAGMWVALPDTSEHQLGLALDIVDNSYWGLDEAQEETETQKWLMENSYKYGFILRYPSDKSEITGINYEPWHYRYVGKPAAKEIYEAGVCLEEYLESK